MQSATRPAPSHAAVTTGPAPVPEPGPRAAPSPAGHRRSDEAFPRAAAGQLDRLDVALGRVRGAVPAVPAEGQPTNAARAGAVIFREPETYEARLAERLAADRAWVFSLLDDGGATDGADSGAGDVAAQARRNTRGLLQAAPGWFRLRIPLWDAAREDGYPQSLGWYLNDNPVERTVAKQLSAGGYDEATRTVTVAATSMVLVGADDRLVFGRRSAEDVRKTVVHEVQHHLDGDEYGGTTVGRDDSLRRFRREFRARAAAGGTVAGFAIHLTAETAVTTRDIGRPDTPTDRVLLETLAHYRTKEGDGEVLLDVYLEDPAFRAACDAFVAECVSRSLNLVNSPRLDALKRAVQDGWSGVLLAGQARPWATVAAAAGGLHEDERTHVTSSLAWRELVAEHMDAAEQARFDALLAGRSREP